MSDLISKQAAIDAAIEAADDWDGGCNIGRQKRIEKYIRQLPPAEPEIIRCKDCKYYEASIACNPWGVCCHKDWVANSIGHNVDETGWCYRAERKTE